MQLSKCSLFILNTEDKGGPTHGFEKQRIYSAQWKYELPGFTILGKRCEWVEEIHSVLLDVPLCVTKGKHSRVWT